jgi:hypothetical protein
VRKERNKRADGGAAIFINKLKYLHKKGLYDLYDSDYKIEGCATELYTGQDKILIVSCYRQPHIKIELRVWKKKNLRTIHYNQLTTWSGLLLEKPTVAQPLKKFTTFNGT